LEKKYLLKFFVGEGGFEEEGASTYWIVKVGDIVDFDFSLVKISKKFSAFLTGTGRKEDFLKEGGRVSSKFAGSEEPENSEEFEICSVDEAGDSSLQVAGAVQGVQAVEAVEIVESIGGGWDGEGLDEGD
jgi:hypothetical protein